MKTVLLVLLIILTIILLWIYVTSISEKSADQSGGAISATEMYRPILPTGTSECRKDIANAPGLDYSSLYSSAVPRSIVWDGRAQDQYYSGQLTPTPYNLPCLTQQPYGNAMATYNYWKYLPNLLESQYYSCDKYSCANATQNGYEALPVLEKCIATQAGKVESSATLACDPVNPDYYNSSADFCRNHPNDYPCANWWMANSPQIRDVSRCSDPLKCRKSKGMKPQVPYMKNDLGFCLEIDSSCEVNDGEALQIINRHHEDQGLC